MNEQQQQAINEFYMTVIDAIDTLPVIAEKFAALDQAGIALEKVELHLFVDLKVQAQSTSTDAQFLKSLRIAPDLTVSARQERP